ncbi:MAG: hypothetical protein RL213_296 [Bacteroidota bacterium]|jgi:hypothetical protein
MKRLIPLVLLLAAGLRVPAQPHGNEWIDYGQPYFKVKVWEDGIYRISKSALSASGAVLAGVDPRKFRIFCKGEEQYLYVQGESDGSFDASDYIEFYGRRNDGEADAPLYADSSWQPNKRFSLFTDTAVYFLTWSPVSNGRRMTLSTDTSYSAYAPSPYCLRESYLQFSNSYNLGRNGTSIEYTEGEGYGREWGNGLNGMNGPLTIQLPTLNAYAGTSSPDAVFETAICGVNNLRHTFSIRFAGDSVSDTYFAQTIRRYSRTVPVSNLPANSLAVDYRSLIPSGQPDYNSLYYASLLYPHTFDFENRTVFEFILPDAAGQNKSLTDISSFPAGNTPPVLYDLTNHVRITVSGSGNSWKALVPDNGNNKRCLLVSESEIRQVPFLHGVNYNTSNFGYFTDFRNLTVDSAYLIVSSRALWSEAQSYRAYRNQTTGGKALLIDINELTDQFAYGIAKHPYCIRNFSAFLLDSWTSVAPPQHLLLAGKSINPVDARYDPSLFALSLVPSYGIPTSDILLTSGVHGSLFDPVIPTGRISARTGNELTDYLSKVQEYESVQSAPPQPWMKEILHFGGGNDPQQQAQLASYLSDFEALMEGPSFGGNVTTYLKFNNDPIVINQSDSLQAQIDSGVAVMTFFGHASGSGFDQSTDDPSEYSNRGRYPLVVANSCLAGDFHNIQRSVSERFVLEPQKAAIGFIASVGLGVPQDLYVYSNSFFRNATGPLYGATVGRLMQQTIRDVQSPNALNIKAVCQEMSLNGDPAIRLNHWPLPDLALDESGIGFGNAAITTDQDTFSMTVRVRNIGKAVTDSFDIRIKRRFPDGSDSIYTVRRGNCFYQDEFRLTMNTGGFGAAGINTFLVEVDPQDSVDESEDYLNNTVSTSLFILSRDIVPVYPRKFAIHPSPTVTLKACTSYPLAPTTAYIFEIDTIDLDVADSLTGASHSPLYRSGLVTDSGGVIQWAIPGYTLSDSTVYFWRVANDSILVDPVRFKWQQSSFQYIPGKTGWSQDAFHQFKDDGFLNTRYDTLGRRFSFVQNIKNLSVLTKGLPDGSQAGYNEIGYKLNNVVMEYNGCSVYPAVMVAVLDSMSLLPWSTCTYDFGQVNDFQIISGDCADPQTVYGFTTTGCRNRPENFFIYRYADTAQMQGLSNLLASVPDGNYILAYSWYTDRYSQYPTFTSAFSGLGLDLTGLNDTVPFILFCKKGSLSANRTVFGSVMRDTLRMNTLLANTWNRGAISGTVIGPARRWESLHWNQSPVETLPGRDEVALRILGLNSATRSWDTLAPVIGYTVGGKDTSLTWIPASQYGYLRLVSNLSDDSLKTPPQMDYWRVYYEDVPECAVNPNRTYYFYDDPLTEGDTLRMSIAIDNIGDLPMDSLDVDFYIYDNDRQRINLTGIRLDSLRTGSYLTASIRVDSTFGLAGNSSLWVEANPYNQRHQEEQFHFNNLAEVRFRVDRDRVNPLLDITFDGAHILDGDIVSGKPVISVHLRDENRFLALNDTAKFKIYLRTPGSQTLQRIYFSNITLGAVPVFHPAILPKNSCRIDWQPVLSEDGTYYIEVEAADISNNESGKYNLRIRFEVINRSTITEVLNYPNPFSTSTRFVFTLTGNELPSYMKIQIMTVTGKIVREITQSELGPIRIGRNITDYAWDGKDEFGDPLAAGLYLYRVITTLNGENVEKRQTDADAYFKKGWGKMYLLR